MKHLIIILSLVCYYCSAYAQSYAQDNPKFTPIITPYDSLSPISIRSTHAKSYSDKAYEADGSYVDFDEQDQKYVGQRILIPDNHRVFKYNSLTDNLDGFMHPIEGGNYLIVRMLNDKTSRPIRKIIVESAANGKNKNGIPWRDVLTRVELDGLAEIVSEKSQDTVIVALNGYSRDHFRSMGFYEKVVQMMKDKEYIATSRTYSDGQLYILDTYSKEKLPVDVPYVEFKCIDFGWDYMTLYALMKSKYGSVAVRIDKLEEVGESGIYKFPNNEWIDKRLFNQKSQH